MWMAGVMALAAVAGLSGCATKKFVQNRVDPLSKRIESLESANKEQGEQIEELEIGVSRADERALTADSKAVAAGEAAKSAQVKAEEVGSEAERAKAAAEKAQQGVGSLSDRIDGLDNFKMVAEHAVLFGFESSRLTDEAQAQLNSAASRLPADGPYVIEVRGFTDQTGNRAYNLALSEKRAQEVVRFLTTQHSVPLHRVFTLGLGSENPSADNKTREGRKMNRRVEVRVYVAAQNEMAAELR